ncbi:unnamed protein product, partial [Gongylonema pulchrum]|uniref:TORC_C domain-containing protein n=1 Tax=Gongylonema pulchrum TaxID=637853 RepID=A0A183EXG4_9BILA
MMPSQPQPLVDAVNAVLLNGEAQVGYGDRLQTNPSAVSPPTGHWPLSSSGQPPPPPPQQQQAAAQMLPNMVPLGGGAGVCPPPPSHGTATLTPPQMAAIHSASSSGIQQQQQQQQVARHSLMEHTYQRHSPYPHADASRYFFKNFYIQQHVATSLPPFPESVRGSAAADCAGVEDLYVMDDFLPTPVEAMTNSTLPQMDGQLPEAARQELLTLGDRFIADPNIEQLPDSQSVIVKFTL